MNLKRATALLSAMALILCLLPQPALALEPGIYTASVITSYYNPDTGNIDDGGTANAALGEGMCRSATGSTALVEYDGKDIWLTVRLLLQSNCKNVKLAMRSGYDSYSQVSYTIMAEDAGEDYIDYRFKASSAGVKLKGTMYVTPMGRDVLWYLYLDTSTLTPGSADFVVSLDIAEIQEEEEKKETQPTTEASPKKEDWAQAVTSSQPEPELKEEIKNPVATQEKATIPAEEPDGEKQVLEEEAGSPEQQESIEENTSAQPEEDKEAAATISPSIPAESARPGETAPTAADHEEKTGKTVKNGKNGMLPIAGALLAGAGISLILLRRRKGGR